MNGWPSHPVVYEVDTWPWLSGAAALVRAGLPWEAVRGRQWQLTDLLDDRDGDELAGSGLYVDLPPWGAHVLALEPR
jgi:hypothetical protein